MSRACCRFPSVMFVLHSARHVHKPVQIQCSCSFWFHRAHSVTQKVPWPARLAETTESTAARGKSCKRTKAICLPGRGSDSSAGAEMRTSHGAGARAGSHMTRCTSKNPGLSTTCTGGKTCWDPTVIGNRISRGNAEPGVESAAPWR